MNSRKLSDFEAEIEAHIAIEADRLCKEGMAEQDALRTARRRFGNVTMSKERFYEETRQPWLDHVAQDLRFALRILKHNPGFATAAIIVLALGIGATTVIFTAVDRLALRPLPFPDSSRLVSIETHKVHQPEVEPWTSTLDYRDVREHNQSFDSVAAISPIWNVIMTGQGEAERLETLYVSASFFPMLGVRAALGRIFVPADDKAGAEAVVILSHKFWQRRFGGDASILGRSLALDGRTFKVCGILPADFFYPGEPVAGKASVIDVWIPLAFNQLYETPRSLRFLKVIGHLKQAASVLRADDDMRRLSIALSTQFPDTNRDFAIGVRSLEDQVAGNVRPMSFLLLGAVGLVLIMACTGVANLLLVRASARAREIFMRVALGASRARLLVQLMIEGLLLATFGGIAGTAQAFAGLRWLMAAAPASLIQSRNMTLDARVLLFTAGLVIASALLASLPPALRLLRRHSHRSLGAGLRESSNQLAGGHHRLRAALVAGQVAFAVTLTVGAGLLLRSFTRLLDVRPGFDTAHVATISTQLPNAVRTPEQRTAMYRLLEERLLGVPGVKMVGAVSRLPLSGMVLGSWLWIEGQPPGTVPPDVEYRVATPSYFPTMGIPLLAGRWFEDRDRDNGAEICVVNETLARSFFRGQDPVGRRVRFGANEPGHWVTIIGVVGDVRHVAIDTPPRPEVYRPYVQNPLGSPVLVMRVEGDPAALLPALSAAVRSVNPDIPAYSAFSMRELARRSTEQRRFVMALLAAFAAAALLLAAVGTYGAASQLVSQRTREIGLRMALGASPSSALAMVMGSGARLTIAGVVAGLAGAAALSRLMRGLLFEVNPLDPQAFAIATLTLAIVTLAACLGPARRATKIAPMTALREE